MAINEKYKVVSLFSGAGGFDWGFHLTEKFQTIFACEVLPQPAATLAHNLRLEVVSESHYTPTLETPIVFQGDVCNVDFSKASICPDVLIGGPPCQDFSVIRSKKDVERPGLNGGRGKLYVEFVRALMFLQPKIFVFENVPGFLSANGGLAIETVLDDIQNLEKKRVEVHQRDGNFQAPHQKIHGYHIVFSEVVEAPNLGVSQTRKRLIILGIRDDLIDTFNIPKLGEQVKLALKGGKFSFVEFPMTCIEIFEGRPLPQLQERYAEIMGDYAALASNADLTKSAKWNEIVWSKLQTGDICYDYFLANGIEDTSSNRRKYEIAMREHAKLLTEWKWLDKPVSELALSDHTSQLIKVKDTVSDRMRMIPPGENYDFVDGSSWAVVGKDISFIYRRAAPLKPAWTVMAYGGGGTYGYHYERERSMLTLRERARIQTFTDDFEFKGSGVRAQIGEAVPPLLGKRIAEQIIEILNCLEQKYPLTLTTAIAVEF